MEGITLKDIVASFVESVDRVSYLLQDHHRRVAVVAYQLGKAYGLSETELQQLVLAASLHDIGALTVIERDQLIQMDIENPHPHAIMGASMLSSFRHFNEISKIIRYHHVYYNEGYTIGDAPDEVPFASYLLHLADRIDILRDPNIWILDQVEVIREQVVNLKGVVFHPDAVATFQKLAPVDQFWLDMINLEMMPVLDAVFERTEPLTMDIELLEELAYTLSRIIDFRSEFTASHSYGVGMVAHELGRLYGLSAERCRELRIAGFLHDIGKIGIPTEIIEKPARLSPSEYSQMKAHAYYTRLILQNIKGMEDICLWASMHHEKYDGSGYPFHLNESSFSIESEIIAYADIFTALTEIRPYREPKNEEAVLQTMGECCISNLGGEIYSLIASHFTELNDIRNQAQAKAVSEYNHAVFNIKTGN